MSRSFNGSSQYISCGNPSWTGNAYSVSMWVKPTSNTGTLFARTNTGSGNPIYFDIDFSAGTARMLVRDEAGNSAFSTKASAYSSGVWTHIGGTRNGNNSLVYVNGVAGTPATASIGLVSNTTSNDIVNIGARALGSTTRSAYLTGDGADPAYWDVELSAADMSALATGASPAAVRPANLLFFAPLVRDLADFVGGVSLADSGATGTTTHPRIYR